MLMTDPAAQQAAPAHLTDFPINAAAGNADAARALSPLMLSDRLIGLAQDADRAGLRGPASALVRLACEVLDTPKAARRRAA